MDNNSAAIGNKYNQSADVVSIIMTMEKLEQLNRNFFELKTSLENTELNFQFFINQIQGQMNKFVEFMNDENVMAMFAQEVNKLIKIREELQEENKKLSAKLELVAPRKKGWF